MTNLEVTDGNGHEVEGAQQRAQIVAEVRLCLSGKVHGSRSGDIELHDGRLNDARSFIILSKTGMSKAQKPKCY